MPTRGRRRRAVAEWGTFLLAARLLAASGQENGPFAPILGQPRIRAYGKIAGALLVVRSVIGTPNHLFAALAASLRSTARWRLTASLTAVVVLGALPALQSTPLPHVHLAATPTASGGWLNQLNLWRITVGLPSLTENATWSAGDYNHSLYMVKNNLVTHYETVGVPYYTAEGDTASRNSNIQVNSTTTTTDEQAIDWWMGAPFHAMGMMDPRLQATGFGSYRDSTTSPWQFGASVDTLRGLNLSAGTWPVVFPGNGSTEPLRTYSGGEYPDPLQACPGYAMPSGLPLFIEVGANVHTTAGAVHSFTGNGAPLAHCVIDSTNAAVGSSLVGRGGVIVIPQLPLQNGVRYVVALTVNGVAYTWAFTVGQTLGGVLAGQSLVGDFNGDGKADLALVGAGGVTVALSNGSTLAKPAPWATSPFYGSKATLAGDVTGDGKADLVAVNAGQTFVMPSTGTGFGPAVGWSNSAFYGTRGTFLADVNGDGKADLVAINDSSVWVMLSTGSGFAPPIPWSTTLFFGTVTTTVGDVTGDGKADLVAVNAGNTWVMPSTGSGFSAPIPWSTTPFYGNMSTFVADVTGDGKADLVAINNNSTWVMTSTGSGFAAPVPWSSTPFYGQLATLPADVDGDKKVDLIAVNSLSVWVAPSTGTLMSAPILWM
jgi:uncharacterized protein YkwD